MMLRNRHLTCYLGGHRTSPSDRIVAKGLRQLLDWSA